MAVNITGVIKKSYAYNAGIKSGEQLLSINGNDIMDVLDYRFYILEHKLNLIILDENNNKREVIINKGQYDDLGLEFETYLMDKQHSCRNKCIFCFIDQLPKGMRESLYFKDDDSRLSFLFGNYITLTNLTEHEISRIIKMHISPINISIHTTNPELRCKMMHNRFAGQALQALERFAKANIKINCQLVLCPGINDGQELIRTLSDLEKLMPAVESIAMVPVGLTKYRDGLYPLKKYDKKSAGDVIDIAESFGNRFIEKYGSRIVCPADEFYIIAERQMPDTEFYGDFAQLENGVGLVTLLTSQFKDALADSDEKIKDRDITIATGISAYPFIQKLVDEAKVKWHNLNCKVIPIINDFFGHDIVVAGLITGTDLINQLKDKDLGTQLLIPSVMLRQERDMFLDNITSEQLSNELNIDIRVVDNDGYELLDAIIGV